MNRQIGVKNFIQVVILDPRTKGHVIQRMRDPKIAMVRYVQPKVWQEISGQYLDNENVSGDAVLWRHTNPTWRMATILKIAKSPYLSEKSSDFDKIWYTKADIEPDDSHMTKNWNF